MNDCVECHEAAEFHACTTCHDDHGSVEMAGVPFSALVLLSGDLPEPAYVPVNDILPYRDQPGTQVSLLAFLAEHGVEDFESVTLAATDGGFVTIERPNLTDQALLLPYVDGVRFAAEDLHVSTWLKGISRIIVVGVEKTLLIDGEATSMGRLLLGPTASVTIEQTDVMLKSDVDGQIRKAKTASRLEGAPIAALVADPGFARLVVRDAQGQEQTVTAKEAQGAVLAQVWGHPEATLVLPARGRSQWPSGVVEIRSGR